MLYTAGDWDVPPAYHGNPWAPGGVGVARAYVYEPLFDYTPANGSFFPRLAESYSETPEALTVTLRADARWHDGEPFTSRDVRATFVLGFLRGMEIWHYLDRIETPDERHVIFHWRLRSPTNSLLVLTEPITSAYHLFGRYVDAADKMNRDEKQRDFGAEREAREVLFAERPERPVGTGPFRLTKVTSADMVLERFSGYPSRVPIHVDGIRVARWSRSEAIWSSLYAGQMDAVSPACPDDVAKEVLRRNPGMRLVLPSDMNEMGLVFNCRSGPLADLRVREALARVLDRDAIRKLACTPGDTSPPVSLGIVPSQAERWLGRGFVSTLPGFDHQEQRARQLLADAGLQRGADGNYAGIKLEIVSQAGSADLALLAEAAAAQLTRFGVPSEVRLLQGELYFSSMQAGHFQVAACFGAQMGRTVHAATAYGRFFSPGGQIEAASGWKPPLGSHPDKLVEQLRMAPEGAESRQLSRELTRMEAGAVRFVPCFEKRLNVFVADGPRVRGWPASDSPLWSAAPLGVENLYASMIARGLVGGQP